MSKVQKKTQDKNLNRTPNKATECAFENLEKQFSEYVYGQRKKFDIKPLGLHADLRELKGTELQKRVWIELLKIPYGTVLTYSELAQRVGNSKAVRAVASAVGSNPLYIVIPCHRVVPKASKTVGNYALGTDLKKILLRIEGVI